MNNKPIAILSLLLITLTICGVAYSHWSESLHISGTIITANGKYAYEFKNLFQK